MTLWHYTNLFIIIIGIIIIIYLCEHLCWLWDYKSKIAPDR